MTALAAEAQEISAFMVAVDADLATKEEGVLTARAAAFKGGHHNIRMRISASFCVFAKNAEKAGIHTNIGQSVARHVLAKRGWTRDTGRAEHISDIFHYEVES